MHNMRILLLLDGRFIRLLYLFRSFSRFFNMPIHFSIRGFLRQNRVKIGVENRLGDPIFHPILDPILAPQKPRNNLFIHPLHVRPYDYVRPPTHAVLPQSFHLTAAYNCLTCNTPRVPAR